MNSCHWHRDKATGVLHANTFHIISGHVSQQVHTDYQLTSEGCGRPEQAYEIIPAFRECYWRERKYHEKMIEINI